MRTSSFEHIVRLQFNSLMLIVIKNKVKSRNRQLARHSKREVLFCEIAETKQVERGTIDTCFYDCVSFKVLHFTIMYLMKHLVQFYIDCQKNSVVRFYYVIFKEWTTEKFQNCTMYHVLLFAVEELED